MKALVFRDGRPELVARAEPGAGADEAVIRVRLAGICGTDLEIARGYLDFEGVPGHEFVGVVESSPDPAWVGRRVVGEINIACRRCPLCASGQPRHCPSRAVLGIVSRDGAFAERLSLPLANLHPVPDSVPDEVAVFTEPLAAAHEILEQVAPPAEGRSLVLGDGRLGQLCALVLASAGPAPVVCGRHPEKLARLPRRGLRTCLEDESLPRGFDLVVEASGSPGGLRRALGLVRPRGTIVLKSTYHGRASLDLAGLVIDEIGLIGSRCGPFEPALAHLASDPDLVDGMITDRFPLARAREAFERAAAPDALKVLLEP